MFVLYDRFSDLEALCKKNPREILRGLETYKSRNQGHGDGAAVGFGAPSSGQASNELNITKFSEMEKSQ